MRIGLKSGSWRIFLASTCLLASPLSAGVVYEIEVKDHEQLPPRTESIEAAVEGRHLKMGIASGGSATGGEMIFRGDRREMVVVDHANQSYVVFDDEALRALGGQVSSAMAQIEEALKNVPEDRRAMVEEMMKQNLPGAEEVESTELRTTGVKEERNGYPCVKYEVLRGGRTIRELWVTDWSNIEGGDQVIGAFEDMADFFRELMDSIPSFGGRGPAIDDNMFEHIRDVRGFPVVTREFGEDGALEGESTLRSANERTLDPDAFEPPSGYKRQEMFRP